MTNRKDQNVTEAEIAVHWKEEQLIQPPGSFIAQANMTDETVLERFGEANFPNCYKEYADLLDWYEYWHTILDESNPPFWRWFVGGKINASYNCIDRHLAKHKNKTAIHFVPEPEDEAIHHMTFQELYVRVNEFAALLRDFCGLKAGDTVTLHMPMTADLAVTMLACARLGVIHSQVFSGFSGKAAADRAVDAKSRVLITGDAYYRAGKLLDHKEKADIAVEEAAKDGQKIEQVLIWQRYPGKYSAATPLVEGRDFIVNDVMKKYRHAIVEPEQLPAEGTLFLMYTSGTTGKPKGCAALDRRLHGVRDRHIEVHPGHPPGGRVLVHGRHRLDHRPLLHHLRSARARRLVGHLRGRAHPPRRGTSVAGVEGARGQHLPHLADGDPRAAAGGPRPAAQVRPQASST